MRMNSLGDKLKGVLRVAAQASQREEDFEKAVRQRGIRAKHDYLAVERLSAEPRGNEIDLRGKR